MRFTVEKIGLLPIFHATTKDRELLALAFMRMQEYYESPMFRGKIFSVDEYVAWYTHERSGFTYASDWSGFNVPSSAVHTVMWHFADHSPEELCLFGALREEDVVSHEHFYLIGSNGSSRETLRHEVCHALYYLEPKYHAVVQTILGRYELLPFRKYLKDMGYGNNVIDDELQAYGMSYLPRGAPRTREFQLFRQELKFALKPFLAYYLAAH
jgi:hypothetical protein